MPFLKGLISKNKCNTLEEDLLNRGWVEMITGNYAYDNDSFYIKPLKDGSHNFTLKYSFKDLITNNDGDLLWEIVEKLEKKVGIMNVPTTYPSPKVNGFFVSGAGGGLYSVKGIPSEMCNSDETRKILEDEGYEIELRFKPSGIVDIDELFDRMNKMMTKRFDTFIKLSVKEQNDFGFLALRATANLQYVIMKEIENYLLKKTQKEIWKKNIENHFRLLDHNIKKLFESLKIKEFIITADHGMVPKKYHANYNIILNDINVLGYKTTKVSRLVKNYLKEGLNIFKRNKFIIDYKNEIDWSRTSVFGKWYSNSIYVNDEKRFSGIVKEKDIGAIVDEVCLKFNKHKVSQAFNLKAIPYSRNFLGTKYYESLPDIKVIADDEIFNVGKGRKAVNKNLWYQDIKSLKNIPTSMFTGTKGKNPLFVFSNGLEQYIKSSDTNDLTLVYKITKRFFENKK